MINKKSKGRTSDDQITLYESVGFAPLDLAVAIETYKKAMISFS